MIESSYALLRVPRDAGPEEVRQAYVRLVRRYPPEHFPEKFASLRRAYQQLTLGEDFIQEISSRIKEDSSPLQIAGFLWGDRKSLKPEKSSPLTDLMALLRGKNTRDTLDGLLEKAASEKIEWKVS
jgi:curved DNA-binding protein CbpA